MRYLVVWKKMLTFARQLKITNKKYVRNEQEICRTQRLEFNADEQ